jgi:uncharacterized DUF497 family protein
MSDFEGDDVKAAANLAKHRISFEDAIAIFNDPAVIVVGTTREADGEERLEAIGPIGARVFGLVYVERKGATRIISARRPDAREEKLFWRHSDGRLNATPGAASHWKLAGASTPSLRPRLERMRRPIQTTRPGPTTNSLGACLAGR